MPHVIFQKTIQLPSYPAIAVAALTLLTVTGCQTVRTQTPKPVVTPNTSITSTTAVTPTQTTAPVVSTATPTAIESFEINGKIGITTPQQAGSAFYTWGQNGKSFAINLAGALNAGQTDISYNGQTATLTNDKGTLTADNPEELLFKATKWQAPISQLPYWIMGQAAPSDAGNQTDAQKRLATAKNGDWLAEFAYSSNKERLPNRITMRHPQGYKVVMTINHLK